MSENGRKINFNGEGGMRQWNRTGGEKKASRQTPKRTYLTMEVTGKEKRRHEAEVARFLRMQ